MQRKDSIKGINQFLLLVALITTSLVGCGQDTYTAAAPFSSEIQISPTSTPIIPEEHDDLGNLVTILNNNMPRAKSEGFIPPSEAEESAFQDIVRAIKESELKLAKDIAGTNQYEILSLYDQGDNEAVSFILQELRPIQHGWGLYAFRAETNRKIVIEAPHPIADKYTSQVAVDLYRALHAEALLISGAHRDANKDGSADAAHAPHSIFQSVHIGLFQYAQQENIPIIFLQIHGFAIQDHPDYPQIVIGHNWENHPTKDLLLQRIAAALQENQIDAGICNGRNFRDLCGTENLQGTTTEGSIFIHLELAESIRLDDQVLIKSLIQVLSP